MARIPRKYVFVWLLSALMLPLQSQVLHHYKVVKARSGQSLNIPVESESYPSFIQLPQHGQANRFKLSFESQYRIRYISDPQFVGLDTIAYQTTRTVGGVSVPYFEGFVVQVNKLHADNDYYIVDHGQPTLLPVLDNDLLVLDQAAIQDIVYVSGGNAQITEDAQQIRFSPSGPGFASITYLVCKDGDCSAAQVVVRVVDRNAPPKSDTTYLEVAKDGALQLLLPPGYAAPAAHFYEGSLNEIARDHYEYRPLLGFTGTEILKFTRLHGGALYGQVYVLRVVDPFAVNGWSHADRFYTERNNKLEFSVLENDLGSNITDVQVESLAGSLVDLGFGRFEFTPNPGFAGQTHFSYSVCQEGRCDESRVALIVSDFQPSQTDWVLYTGRDQALNIDYRIPIDAYHFELRKHPVRGSIVFGSESKTLQYLPPAGYLGEDDFELDYCVNNGGVITCSPLRIKVRVQEPASEVPCNDGCVWPGDANADGLVSIADVLPVGANLGETGPLRQTDPSMGWFGYAAQPWLSARHLGTPDAKHVDADGNGLISAEDLSDIDFFYGFAHDLSPSPIPGDGSVSLHMELLTPYVKKGDRALVRVSMGDEQQSVRDLLGVNFSLELNSHFVDSSSFVFTLAEKGLFQHAGEALSFALSPKDGRFDIGIAAISGEAISGHGVLGDVSFIVEEDLNGFRSAEDILKLDIRIKDPAVLDKEGIYSTVPESRVSMLFERESGVLSNTSFFFPNPADDYIQFPTQTEGVKVVRLYNLQGQLVMERVFNAEIQPGFIDVSTLLPGIYLIETTGYDNQRRIGKVQILSR